MELEITINGDQRCTMKKVIREKLLFSQPPKSDKTRVTRDRTRGASCEYFVAMRKLLILGYAKFQPNRSSSFREINFYVRLGGFFLLYREPGY